MRNTIVRCSGCDRALSLPHRPGNSAITCGHCMQKTKLWIFPALFREKKSSEAQYVRDDGHSSCMNHPARQAVVACDGCGKFLCALCDVDWNGEHLCSACIEYRKTPDTTDELRTEYIHYDRIVFELSIASWLFYFLGLALAPIALYVGLRYWNAPWSPVPHRKWRMLISLSIALLALLLWGSIITFAMIRNMS